MILAGCCVIAAVIFVSAVSVTVYRESGRVVDGVLVGFVLGLLPAAFFAWWASLTQLCMPKPFAATVRREGDALVVASSRFGNAAVWPLLACLVAMFVVNAAVPHVFGDGSWGPGQFRWLPLIGAPALLPSALARWEVVVSGSGVSAVRRFPGVEVVTTVSGVESISVLGGGSGNSVQGHRETRWRLLRGRWRRRARPAPIEIRLAVFNSPYSTVNLSDLVRVSRARVEV